MEKTPKIISGIQMAQASPEYFVQNNFCEDVKRASGSAFFIVHPFFPDIRESFLERYKTYIRRLNNSVACYERRAIPIVLMEESINNLDIPNICNRLGLESERAYVVPTEKADPKPIGQDLFAFSHSLRRAGLRKAVVSGSLFTLEEKDSFYPQWNKHILNRSFHFRGCVGALINSFSNAGIYAVPGHATYPGRDDIKKKTNKPESY